MAHGCSVDTGVGSLRIGAEEVPLHKPLAFQVARCHRVVALEDTVISPYSEILVPAKIVDEPYGEPWGSPYGEPQVIMVAITYYHTSARCYGRKNISGCSA